MSISIHAPREGCDHKDITYNNDSEISIHAPREGCDQHLQQAGHQAGAISIHAPREGCDRTTIEVMGDDYDFNPRTP